MKHKDSFEFGTGSFVGDYLQNNVGDLSTHEQALALAWPAGCPVAIEVTNPNNTDPGRGPEAMLRRYAETNFWFGQILREISEVNPSLSAEMMKNLTRKAGEPVGKYEPESVPEEYTEELAPRNTLAGFALPRLFVEYLHAAGDDRDTLQSRVATGLDFITSASRDAEDPLDLLALVASRLHTEGELTDERIFKHVFSAGWVREHNSVSTLQDLAEKLHVRDPNMYQRYSQMSAEEKHQNQLA
ncbi:hypothetical protein KBD20_00075 [Candidatus Saccharibacteria bacterium]|nr:hypothetical protein [Candidatus Saccharibacteria bacterium]